MGIADATLDRLFRHMSWANQQILLKLTQLTPAQMQLCARGSEWSVARIASHLVEAQCWYVWRLAKDACDDLAVPTEPQEFVKLAELLKIADARLCEEAALPDGTVEYERDGRTIVRLRSTVLGQAIHHATEHRAQIADALAAHGIPLIDLDALDLWSFGATEGPNI